MNCVQRYRLQAFHFLFIMLRGISTRATLGTQTWLIGATGALAWRSQGAAVAGFRFPTDPHPFCFEFLHGWYALVRHAWLCHVCLSALVSSQERKRSRAYRSAMEAGIGAAQVMGYVGPPRTRGPRARGSAAGRFRAGLSRRVTRSRLMRRATRAGLLALD